VLASIYAVLLVVEVRLLVKYARGGVVSAMPELAEARGSEKKEKKDDDGGTPGAPGQPGDSDDVLAFAY
jgi:cytochrome bd ubiquinol oxidase subunit I